MTVVKYVGSEWVSVGTPRFSTYQAMYCSFYIYDGIPYVAFTEYRSGDDGYRLAVMNYDGEDWVYIPISPPIESRNPSIFVYNQIPYVAYINSGDDSISVVKYGYFVPILEDPEDHNTPGYSLTFNPNIPADYVNTESQVVGNGCIKLNPNSSITLIGDSLYEDDYTLAFYMYDHKTSDVGDWDTTPSGFTLVIGEDFNNSITLRYYKEHWESEYHKCCELYSNGTRVGYDDYSSVIDCTGFYIQLKISDINNSFVVSGDFEFEGNFGYAHNLDKISLNFFTDSTTEDPYILLDNIIIHGSTSINLYPYRGFDVYTPVVPDEPDEPTDDIVFWWTGMKDQYDLPALRYYEGEDYCFEYTLGHFLVKESVSDKIIDDANASLTTYEGLSTNNYLNLTRARIGYWFVANEDENYGYAPEVYFVGHDVAEFRINSGTQYHPHSNTHFDLTIGWSIGLYARFEYPTPLVSGETYWMEIQIDTSTFPIVTNAWLNTVPCTLVIPGDRSFTNESTGWNFLYDAGTNGRVQNIILSTDDTLDIWNTYHDGVALPYMTHYPTTEPDESELLFLSPLAPSEDPSLTPNFFQFITYDGTTEAKYPTELTLPDEEEHFIEYKYDIPNRQVALRIDEGEWAEQEIGVLSQDVEYVDMKFYIEPIESPPPPPTGDWFLWYSCDSDDIQADHDYFIDPGVTSVIWSESSSVNALAAKVGVAGLRTLTDEYNMGLLIGNITETPGGIRFGLWARRSVTSDNNDGGGVYIADNLISPTFLIACGVFNFDTMPKAGVALMISGEEYYYTLDEEFPKDNEWYWIESELDFTNSTVRLYINNELSVEDTIPDITPPFKDAAITLTSGTAGYIDLDQILINTDLTVTLWDYRDTNGKPA
jgi:hypothetical protein